MDPVEAADSTLLSHYEGLVRTTSSRYVEKTTWDFDDLCQIFRIKAWKALLAWDPTHPRIQRKIKAGKTEEELRDAFVFMCILNQGKDLVKRRKPENDPLFIEDLAHNSQGKSGLFDSREGTKRDWFESQYLCADESEVFEAIVGESQQLPDEVFDLSPDERQVLVCMYLQYSQPEIAMRLGMKPKKVSAAVKVIKQTFSHLKPTAELELAQVAA